MLHFVEGSRELAEPPAHRKAIVSIIIGDSYVRTWRIMSQANWEAYAERHNYDLIIITDHLDASERGRERSVSWQKLLVLDQPWAGSYDRILWLDSDIVISAHAPNILESASDREKVGICLSGGKMSRVDQHIYCERSRNLTIPPQEADSYIAKVHVDDFKHEVDVAAGESPVMFNGGVLVVTPGIHNDLFREVYECDGTRSRLYEQPQLSYRLSTRGLAQILSPRFNWNVHEILVMDFPPDFALNPSSLEFFLAYLGNELTKSYFLHFAGSMPLLQILADLSDGHGYVLGKGPPRVSVAPAGEPSGDYVSPGMVRVWPDAHFPNMIVGDAKSCGWPYLRQGSPHSWYVDKRAPGVGFLSRDEAHILYNTALQAYGKPALEIGCLFGWSACHLALAGVQLDVIDPGLADSTIADSVIQSLRGAGVLDRCRLFIGSSPGAVSEIAGAQDKRWSLIFIDGNHEAPSPREDAEICAQFAAEDCIVLFHDLLAPAVAEGLRFFKQQGWNVRVYRTTQIVGVAWRGAMRPVGHIPDPRLPAEMPVHLEDLL